MVASFLLTSILSLLLIGVRADDYNPSYSNYYPALPSIPSPPRTTLSRIPSNFCSAPRTGVSSCYKGTVIANLPPAKKMCDCWCGSNSTAGFTTSDSTDTTNGVQTGWGRTNTFVVNATMPCTRALCMANYRWCATGSTVQARSVTAATLTGLIGSPSYIGTYLPSSLTTNFSSISYWPEKQDFSDFVNASGHNVCWSASYKCNKAVMDTVWGIGALSYDHAHHSKTNASDSGWRVKCQPWTLGATIYTWGIASVSGSTANSWCVHVHA